MNIRFRKLLLSFDELTNEITEVMVEGKDGYVSILQPDEATLFFRKKNHFPYNLELTQVDFHTSASKVKKDD